MRMRTRTQPAILVTVTSAVLGVSYLTRTGANDDPTTHPEDGQSRGLLKFNSRYLSCVTHQFANVLV